MYTLSFHYKIRLFLTQKQIFPIILFSYFDRDNHAIPLQAIEREKVCVPFIYLPILEREKVCVSFIYLPILEREKVSKKTVH
jgi:hypothetical protein